MTRKRQGPRLGSSCNVNRVYRGIRVHQTLTKSPKGIKGTKNVKTPYEILWGPYKTSYRKLNSNDLQNRVLI